MYIQTCCFDLHHVRITLIIVHNPDQTVLVIRCIPSFGPAVFSVFKHFDPRFLVCYVLAVMAEAKLGYLDGVEVALWSPLGGNGHTCSVEDRKSPRDTILLQKTLKTVG